MMNPFRIAAAFGHRRDSGVRLHLDGGLPARTVCAECGSQTWSANLPGARKTIKHIVVGMLSKCFSNVFIKLLHGSDQQTQLDRINLHGQTQGFDNRRIVG